MATTKSTRRGLAVVAPPLVEEIDRPTIWFCGHCGARPESDQTPAPAARVCSRCNLGLLLESDADAAPRPDEAFMVLDATLSVCALSRKAEKLLATSETEAVNRHITELVVPADTEAQGGENLAVAITWAARGDEATRHAMVRPARTFGVRLRVRITSCGPPRAALLVFES